jgi:hypothetical protein
VVSGACWKERRQSQRKLSELSMRSTASALRQQTPDVLVLHPQQVQHYLVRRQMPALESCEWAATGHVRVHLPRELFAVERLI